MRVIWVNHYTERLSVANKRRWKGVGVGEGREMAVGVLTALKYVGGFLTPTIMSHSFI